MSQRPILTGLLLLLLAGPFASITYAQEGETIPSSDACQIAWSKGFDAATKFSVENPADGLAVYLNQNEIAQIDMWKAYRTIGARYQCLLEAVCSGVHLGGDPANFTAVLAPINARGGAIPGEFAPCPAGATVNDLIGTFAIAGEFQAADLLACDFSDSRTPEEEREERLDMYISCRRHAKLQSLIFNRMLRNMTMDDTNRKTAGYFSLQVMSLIERISSLQDQAAEFVGMFNAVTSRLCTLNNPD